MLLLVPTRLEIGLLFPELTPPVGLGTTRWSAAPGRAPVHVATCGFGLAAAAAGACAHLARAPETSPAEPSACLVGIAGTLQPEVARPGMVVLATQVEVEGCGLPAGAVAPGALAHDLRSQATPPPVAPEAFGPDVLRCGALSVGVPSSDVQEAAGRARRHPECAIEEMEAHGVLHAARVTGRSVAVLRGVSNFAGDRRHEAWVTRDAATAVRRALEAWLASR